jgi:hypothetical protein
MQPRRLCANMVRAICIHVCRVCVCEDMLIMCTYISVCNSAVYVPDRVYMLTGPRLRKLRYLFVRSRWLCCPWANGLCLRARVRNVPIS